MQRLKICLYSYDSRLLDQAIKNIIAISENFNAHVSGPVLLPTRKKVYTVIRSVHKHKDSREQFEIRRHSRLLTINQVTDSLVNELKNINLPSLIDLSIING